MTLCKDVSLIIKIKIINSLVIVGFYKVAWNNIDLRKVNRLIHQLICNNAFKKSNVSNGVTTAFALILGYKINGISHIFCS